MRVVPAKNGWLWLVRGFALFRKSPPMWLFLVFTYWIAATLLGQIRYVGPAASTVLLPAFFVSFMVMCAVIERGGLLRPGLLFAGFRSGLSTLIALGALSLVAIVVVLGVAALRLSDRPLDDVLGHVLGACREDRRTEPRVERRVGLAELRSGGDFAGELAEQLGARLILAPLAVHDVLELRMSGHDLPCDSGICWRYKTRVR